MKTKNILLTIMVSGILTACGSSSSQGTVDTTSSDIRGDALLFKKETYDSRKHFKNPGMGLNKLVIEGKEVTLLPEDHNEGFYEHSDDDKHIYKAISGKEYKYTRFGIYKDGYGEDNYSKLFAIGVRTKDMPTSGSAIYKGDAVLSHQFALDDGNFLTAEHGKSLLEVNFAEKMVEGTLSNWEHSQDVISFNANINGTKIESDKVNGRFFGPNAAEAAGVYRDEANHTFASFGGIKQ